MAQECRLDDFRDLALMRHSQCKARRQAVRASSYNELKDNWPTQWLSANFNARLTCQAVLWVAEKQKLFFRRPEKAGKIAGEV